MDGGMPNYLDVLWKLSDHCTFKDYSHALFFIFLFILPHFIYFFFQKKASLFLFLLLSIHYNGISFIYYGTSEQLKVEDKTFCLDTSVSLVYIFSDWLYPPNESTKTWLGCYLVLNFYFYCHYRCTMIYIIVMLWSNLSLRGVQDAYLPNHSPADLIFCSREAKQQS